MRIVFDDQQNAIAFLQIVAVVFDASFLLDGRDGGDEDRARSLNATRLFDLGKIRHRGTDVGLRQDKA